MKVELLSLQHLNALLTLRTPWFELHIEAQPKGFYTRSSVERHIKQLVRSCSLGAAYPAIIECGGQMVGRVNLTKIVGSTKARLGYRIDQEHTGRGLASQAVAHMLDHARRSFDCFSLVAFVSVQNLASQRVLSKNGFLAVGRRTGHALVGGQLLDCIEYELSLR